MYSTVMKAPPPPPAHVEHGRRSGSVPLKEKRILAVAQITCTPVIAGSEALAFNKGDTIAVLKKSSTGVYFGTSNGQTGSFLAQDVVFFKGESWGVWF